MKPGQAQAQAATFLGRAAAAVAAGWGVGRARERPSARSDRALRIGVFAEAMPNNAIFLVDTYDTIEGVKKAV